jgi:hypothetical protein
MLSRVGFLLRQPGDQLQLKQGGLSFPLLVGQQEVALHPAGCEE